MSAAQHLSRGVVLAASIMATACNPTMTATPNYEESRLGYKELSQCVYVKAQAELPNIYIVTLEAEQQARIFNNSPEGFLVTTNIQGYNLVFRSTGSGSMVEIRLYPTIWGPEGRLKEWRQRFRDCEAEAAAKRKA